MAHSKILDKNKTALVVVDVQEAFRSAISDFPMLASKISLAVRGFQILESAGFYYRTISERSRQNRRGNFDQYAAGF